MTIENSELNTSGPLKSSNAGLTGGSGDGNRLVVADLARGYTVYGGPADVPAWLPQNSDNGDTYVGDTFDPPQGFAERPAGWER